LIDLPVFSKDDSSFFWSDKTSTSDAGQVAFKGPLVIRRIALVRPGDYPEGLIVPLGLLYLASYLRKKIPEIEFIVIDAPLEDLNDKEVAEKIRAFNPDLVGLTGLTYHTPHVQSSAREIKRLLPDVPIIAGGAGVSSDPADVLKEKAIDFGVLGEGEDAFYALIKIIEAGEVTDNLTSVAYRNTDGKVVWNKDHRLIEDPDDIPFPAYDLLSVEKYFTSPKRTAQSPVYISKRILPILSSRGCPLKCVFCHDTLGKKFRHRSPDNIVNEIIWLQKTYNFEELEIVDDIFNFDIKHAKLVFKKLIEADLGLKIAFPNGIKYEMVDDEFLELFKQCGGYRIAFGIESADPEGQKIVKKKTDVVRLTKIINQADKMGYFTSGFFQLGLPGETKEQMLNTVKFALGSKLHTAMFHLTTPFPGTPMYEEHVRNKIESGEYNDSREKYEAELKKKVTFVGARELSLNLSAVSDKELITIKKNAFRKFYFNPKRILSIWRVYPVKKRLVKNFINVLSEMYLGRWIIQS
jgi:anaerobic magnesium-protoporphyrin IX monomethyl ester cyclase